jgi:hypothetical protein
MNELITVERRAPATSSLVRRLVQAQHDSVKRRARQWLVSMDDQRLLNFGLTAEDIAVLRAGQASIGADLRPLPAEVGGAAQRPAGARRPWSRPYGLRTKPTRAAPAGRSA